MTTTEIPTDLTLDTLCAQVRELLNSVQCEKAIALSERALSLYVNEPRLLRDYAAGLSGLARHAEALTAIETALQYGANTPDDHIMHGQVLACLHRWEEANAAFRRVMSFSPDNSEWKLYLGHIWMSVGNPTYAGQYAREMLLRDPENIEAHALLGYARLAQGNYMGGFLEYDWLRKLNIDPPVNPEKPEWNGETLRGETVLVYAESGLGDTIQYTRFVPEVVARGGRVILLSQPGLGRLLRSIEGVSEVREFGEPLPEYDFHVSLLRLPLLFRVKKETLLAPESYLAPPAEALIKWRPIVEAIPGFRIGVGWRSAANFTRSFPLALLAQIAEIPGVTLVNVQKGEAADELRAADLPFEMIDLGSGFEDFADTAAVISQLDLMITADISVAHVAGALGKATLILTKHGPDWRLCEKDEHSSWYSHTKIYKQPSLWDWQGAMSETKSEVERILTASVVVTPRANENVSDDLLTLAQNLYHACDMTEARKSLEALSPELKGSKEALALLGRIDDAQGRTFSAERNLIAAFDADLMNLELGKDLATICYKLGTFDLGITVLYRLLEIAPFDTEVSRLLAMHQRAKRAVSKSNFYVKILNSEALVFDVGANIGQSAQAFLEAGARKVVAFDPNPNCLSVLREKFDAEPRVTLVPKGVGAEKGVLPFSVCEEISGISTFSESWKTGRFVGMEWGKTELVEVTTLDAAIGEYGVPDYLKIDVEGFEGAVLAGLSRAVPVLSFEFSGEFPEATANCLRRLSELGFTHFNAVVGGWKQFVFLKPVSVEVLVEKLVNHSDPLIVGDIFAFS